MREYVKRSANEKVFDSKGFKSKKRYPMYNKKYIERAKKNIEEGSFDDKYDDVQNPYYEKDELEAYNLSNRKMYKDMAEMQETKQNISNKYKQSGRYPKIRDVGNTDQAQIESLKQEIKNIREKLEETQDKLSKQKYPTASSSDKIPAQNEVEIKEISPPTSPAEETGEEKT
jgi:hypothetical protein